MTLKPDPSKFVDFRLLEGPRQEQEAQRPPKGSHEGAPNGAKMVNNEVQEGLQIWLVSKWGPKWLLWPPEGVF